MSKVVFLDTGVLGYVTHPLGSPKATECTEWLAGLLDKKVRVCLPEVCDYELRREYVLNKSAKALEKLDQLKRSIDYVPIRTTMMLRAADMWADARRRGLGTADKKELDVDVILAAQALDSSHVGDEVIIATLNVGHLARYATARDWLSISA